jgi:glyoxylase-like metal-dependent hydrolase (beta-lactamase superfamily II)
MTFPFYFKQLEIGPMQNFVYLVGSTETRKAAVVDAAWDIDTILRVAAEDEMEISHALVTHTHPDHVGGSFAGKEIQGLGEILARLPLKVVINKAEAGYLKTLSASDLIKVDSGDEIDLGGLKIKLIHTPGHTPGSQCFLIEDTLISGDTLFIDSCGRVDLPGSNPEEMYLSLTQKLMALPEKTILFPGHNYAPKTSSTIGEQKRTNPYMRFQSLRQFLSAMGYA